VACGIGPVSNKTTSKGLAWLVEQKFDTALLFFAATPMDADNVRQPIKYGGPYLCSGTLQIAEYPIPTFWVTPF
jgi:hypothetical protein